MPIAADGPSTYDIGTGVIALLGLAVSAYSVWRQVKRDKRTVRVKCNYSFTVGAISAIAPETMVTVDILNEGHRPAAVRYVGFELADKRSPVLQPVTPGDASVTLPVTLGDGESVSLYYDLAELEATEQQSGQLIARAYADVSGVRVYGRYVKR